MTQAENGDEMCQGRLNGKLLVTKWRTQLILEMLMHLKATNGPTLRWFGQKRNRNEAGLYFHYTRLPTPIVIEDLGN